MPTVSADYKSAHANCGRILLLISFLELFGSFCAPAPVSFQFRNAAVNVAEAGSDVRLRGAQMEEVCNSRVKEINFSMRALFSTWNQTGETNFRVNWEAVSD